MQDTLDAAQADAESVVVDRLSSLLSTLDLAVNFWTIAAMADFNCFFHVFFVLYGQHVCVIQQISTKPRKEGWLFAKTWSPLPCPGRGDQPQGKSHKMCPDSSDCAFPVHEPGRLQEGDGTISEEKLITLFENPKVAGGQGWAWCRWNQQVVPEGIAFLNISKVVPLDAGECEELGE